MRTAVTLEHEPGRKLPWIVRWYGEPNEEGRQRHYSRSFSTSREAKAFRDAQQVDMDRGNVSRDRVEPIPLQRLIAEFTAARVAGKCPSTVAGYEGTFRQLVEHFGKARDIQAIDVRHAETFIATRRRVDGKPRPLAAWSRRHHLKHCRALFRAAKAWGYRSDNPFEATGGKADPLRINAKNQQECHPTPLTKSEGLRDFCQ